jgi:hypothetical protein
MPWSMSGKMESLLKRAQDDLNIDDFLPFTKKEITAYNEGEMLLYVKVVEEDYIEVVSIVPLILLVAATRSRTRTRSRICRGKSSLST